MSLTRYIFDAIYAFAVRMVKANIISHTHEVRIYRILQIKIYRIELCSIYRKKQYHLKNGTVF